MQRIRTIFRLLVLTIVALFLHYVLPQHDVVKVTGTEIIRTDFSTFNRMFYAQADSGNTELTTRDLRLIQTTKQRTYLLGFISRDETGPMIFRNEDTGWIYPPYFKFDSSDLQAEAAALAGQDQWAVVTHYGWRIRWATIYPNAVAIRTVDGPDVQIIPWFNIGFFIFLGFCLGMIRAMWRQFRERSVDPLLEAAEDQYDEIQAGVARRKAGARGWLNTWRKKEDRK